MKATLSGSGARAWPYLWGPPFAAHNDLSRWRPPCVGSLCPAPLLFLTPAGTSLAQSLQVGNGGSQCRCRCRCRQGASGRWALTPRLLVFKVQIPDLDRVSPSSSRASWGWAHVFFFSETVGNSLNSFGPENMSSPPPKEHLTELFSFNMSKK